MTREEYKHYADYIEMDCGELVDCIFDDFESRTCGNCTYFGMYRKSFCDNVNLATENDNFFVPKSDFGCNYFEKKQ